MEPGNRLGPYEILSRIGAGGMGEVWRARDTRLGREVAIKILPTEFAQDAKLKIRFEREARTVSHIAHPNICTLFDVGENYLVMELLEGESLAARLARGPLSLPEVVRYGVQIAEALGQAHRQGVVHRDVKPGNVMLTKSGAKLLDFGLAKSTRVEAESRDETVQKAITEQGAVLGTFQYMAPEQLAGEEPDARTDIFALGAVLYEMATGKRAFEGKNRTSLIGAIVSGEPRAIRDLQPLTPPGLEHVILKCLEKDPEDRWQNASDIAEELRWISQAGSAPGIAPAVALQRRTRRRIVVSTAVIGWLLAIAATITAGVYIQRFSRADRVTRTEIAVSLASSSNAPLSISPDGRIIAAVVLRAADRHLWLRDLSSVEGRILAGTEGASFPFWSPDGRSIGFFSGAKLKTINIETSAISILCDAPKGRGGAWSPSGVIVFSPDIHAPLHKVEEDGGTPVVVTKVSDPLFTHRNPVFLPDGRHFAYSRGDDVNSFYRSALHVAALDGSIDRKLLDYGSTAAFARGWLLTVRGDNLVAQKFDEEQFRVTGKPIIVAPQVERYGARFLGVFALGGDTLVYRATRHPRRQVVRLTATGPEAIGDAAEFQGLVVSPDGKLVAMNRIEGTKDGSDVWLVSLEDGSTTRATFDAAGTAEDTSAFSPDAANLLITRGARGDRSMLIQPTGGGTRDVLFTSKRWIVSSDWSSDGQTVLFDTQESLTGWDIGLIRLGGDRKPVPLLKTGANEQGARFSPDGRWVAYRSDETGRSEVYVTNFPSASAKWQVSQQGGTAPRWSVDGSRLYFRSGGRIFFVDVNAASVFSAGRPRAFNAFGGDVFEFDIARNGTMVALREIDSDERPISVIQNWQKLLLREH